MSESVNPPTLRRITVIAVVVATLLTITTVLPAEFAVDPTGVGSKLGLTQMGRIKIDLARKAEREP